MRPLLSRCAPHLNALLPPAQDPSFPDPLRHPLAVEILQERDRVLARDAQQILDVGRSDLLLFSKQGDQLALDLPEGVGVEVEALLDPDEPPVGDEELEELALRVLGRGRRGARPPKLRLDPVDDLLLLPRALPALR